MEQIGWIGAILFAICGVPQAIKVWWTHKTRDLSLTFLLMWWFGEILTFAYVVHDNYEHESYQWPLITNYVVNFIIVSYLLWAKRAYKNV